MSPYATELAEARLDALRTLIDALNEAETPDEKRRCAVAIFNAPDPCDLDDSIELEDDEDQKGDDTEDDADIRADSEATEDSAHSEPSPASTSHTTHPTSDISIGIPTGLTNEDIIAKAAALIRRGGLNHLTAPPLPPPILRSSA